jgi:hypothetical protein
VDGNLCGNYKKTDSTVLSLALCQDVLDSSDKKCWWKADGTTCIVRTCADAPTVTDQ